MEQDTDGEILMILKKLIKRLKLMCKSMKILDISLTYNCYSICMNEGSELTKTFARRAKFLAVFRLLLSF